MTHDENIFRKTQRASRDVTRKVSKKISESPHKERIANRVSKDWQAVSKLYDDANINRIIKPASDAVSQAYSSSKKSLKNIDEVTQLTAKAETIKNGTNKHIARPAKNFMAEKGISAKLTEGTDITQNAYGDLRKMIKPYFAADDAQELLLNTHKEITKITASILQVSNKDAAGWIGSFGKLVTAKVAGIAGTASLFGLVSTFGTAGTSAAISGLAGAAANNATIAALGFGGGMATGALVLAGFGVFVGMVTYKFVLSAQPRLYEDLSEEEKRIVETCGILAAAITHKLNETPLQLYADDAISFRESLEVLHKHLVVNSDRICCGLDAINSLKYRKHILIDFQPAILNQFSIYASKTPFSPAGIISGVFHALLTRTALDGSPEQDMVLEALRRSKKDLHDASESELSDYLHELTPAQQRGVANNVKGLYHELKYVDDYNSRDEDTYAQIHSSTSHQGSDVVIRTKASDEIIDEYQLKATNNEAHVHSHQTRYAEIEIKVTEEMALRIDDVESSGHSNVEMTKDVETVFINVSDNTVTDRIIESGTYSGLAKAGFESLKMLQGKSNLLDAGKGTLRVSANSAAATGITAFFFG